MFDPFTIFLQETKIEPKQKTEKFESVQPSTPSDSIVINEDEEKFKTYILKQKKESSSQEKALNQELIEQHQEMIIENEEWVPAYKIPEDKLLKVEKFRPAFWRKKIQNILPRRENVWNWLKREKKIIGQDCYKKCKKSWY